MGRCAGNCALNKGRTWFGESPFEGTRYKVHLTSSTFALYARRALGTFRVGNNKITSLWMSISLFCKVNPNEIFFSVRLSFIFVVAIF